MVDAASFVYFMTSCHDWQVKNDSDGMIGSWKDFNSVEVQHIQSPTKIRSQIQIRIKSLQLIPLVHNDP